MKPEEIRIGNHLKSSTGEFVVKYIDFDEWHSDPPNYCVNSLKLEHVQPIPLTEEWLIKFGFENDEGVFVKRYSRLHDEDLVSFVCAQRFSESKESCFFLWTGNNNSPHAIALNIYPSVHSLQNLYFALTGTELKINN